MLPVISDRGIELDGLAAPGEPPAARRRCADRRPREVHVDAVDGLVLPASLVVIGDRAATDDETAEAHGRIRQRCSGNLACLSVSAVRRRPARSHLPVRPPFGVNLEREARIDEPELGNLGTAEEERQDADTPDDRIQGNEGVALHVLRVGQSHAAQLDVDVRKERNLGLAGEADGSPRPARNLFGDAVLGEVRRNQERNRRNRDGDEPNQAEGKHDDALHASRNPSRRVNWPADTVPALRIGRKQRSRKVFLDKPRYIRAVCLPSVASLERLLAALFLCQDGTKQGTRR
jgi:hypothetical protein